MLIGWAAKYNSLSHEMGPSNRRFRERIQPGVFERSLDRGGDPIATVDHEERLILGRKSSGTLRLKVEERGLYVEVDAPDTTYARDLQESIKRGDIKGMSFAFKGAKDRWDKEVIEGRSTTVRTLEDLELIDVAFVTRPAYAETEVAIRSLTEWGETQFDQAAANERRLKIAEAE